MQISHFKYIKSKILNALYMYISSNSETLRGAERERGERERKNQHVKNDFISGMELMALQSKNFLQWWSGRQSRAQLVSDESQSVSVAHLLYFIFCYVYRSVGASMVRVWGFPVIVMYCCMSWYFFIVRKNFQVLKLQVDTIENIVGFFLESLLRRTLFLSHCPSFISVVIRKIQFTTG